MLLVWNQRIQWDSIFDPKRTNRRAPQRLEVRAAADRRTQVARQRANVGALAT